MNSQSREPSRRHRTAGREAGKDETMNDMMKRMAERMASKIRVMKISVDHYENKRNCPFYSELKGMEQALNTMGIDYKYDYNGDYEIVAVAVGGHKVAV
jgi:hypothetical protein